MVIFKSEESFLEELDMYDALIVNCASRRIDYDDFSHQYRDFYWRRALDGHESDEEERAILMKYSNRIELHRIVAEEILGHVCSAENAKLEIYINASRFGPSVAGEKMGKIAARMNKSA